MRGASGSAAMGDSNNILSKNTIGAQGSGSTLIGQQAKQAQGKSEDKGIKGHSSVDSMKHSYGMGSPFDRGNSS